MLQYRQNKGAEQAFQSTGSGAAGAVQGLRETTGNSIKYMEDKEMTKNDLKKNKKYWCWWLHRSLYYTGKVINGKYVFIDDIDAQFRLSEDKLAKMAVR